MNADVLREFKMCFPDADLDGITGIDGCIARAYESTDTQFIILLDEYDVLFREADAAALVNPYLKLLNALFKSSDMSECIALAYITGILPIIREKAQSKLNNFEEITFLDSGKFAQFAGFTEVETRSLCENTV